MIGIGILTYNREKYFHEVYQSVVGCNYDRLVVVNDGTPYQNKPTKGHYIQHSENRGVASSKNEMLHYLLLEGCKHNFIIEDDILVKDCNVFKEYIHTAAKTGLYHLNFGQAAPNTLQLTVNYGKGVVIDLWRNPQGAFSYYFTPVLQKVGLLDENYVNAFEHIDYTFRLTKVGLMPPFWYFPDIANSTEFLQPIKGSSEASTITNKGAYQKNWNKSAQHFIAAHGHFTSEIRMLHETQVAKVLNFIHKNYSKEDEVNTNNQLISAA